MRLVPLLVWLAGCAEPAPSLESDLESLALSHESRIFPPKEGGDGSVVLDPAFAVRAALSNRLVSSSPGAIPELFRLARANPRMTCPALGVIGGSSIGRTPSVGGQHQG